MFHWLTSPKISWRPRRVDGVVLLQKPAGSRPRRNWSFSLNPKAWGKMITQLEGSQIGGIPPYSGNGQPWVPFRSSVIGWGPPSLQRATCFIQSIDLNTKLVQKKKSLRNNQNNIWPNIWEPHGPVKVIYKIILQWDKFAPGHISRQNYSSKRHTKHS